MVPVETTAFALLSVCVILLAAVVFFSLVSPGNAPVRARPMLLVALAVIVVLSIYVLVTTRMR